MSTNLYWELKGINVHTGEKRVLTEGYGTINPMEAYGWKIGDLLWGWFKLEEFREITFEEIIS